MCPLSPSPQHIEDSQLSTALGPVTRHLLSGLPSHTESTEPTAAQSHSECHSDVALSAKPTQGIGKSRPGLQKQLSFLQATVQLLLLPLHEGRVQGTPSLRSVSPKKTQSMQASLFGQHPPLLTTPVSDLTPPGSSA